MVTHVSHTSFPKGPEGKGKILMLILPHASDLIKQSMHLKVGKGILWRKVKQNIRAQFLRTIKQCPTQPLKLYEDNYQ